MAARIRDVSTRLSESEEARERAQAELERARARANAEFERSRAEANAELERVRADAAAQRADAEAARELAAHAHEEAERARRAAAQARSHAIEAASQQPSGPPLAPERQRPSAPPPVPAQQQPPRQAALVQARATAAATGAVATVRERAARRRFDVRLPTETTIGIMLVVLGITVAILFLTGAVKLDFAP
jgi:hypothetical protein